MGKKASTIWGKWGLTCLLFVALVSVVVPMAAADEDVRLHPFVTEQRLWIGTERGLCRLDMNTGRVVGIYGMDAGGVGQEEIP